MDAEAAHRLLEDILADHEHVLLNWDEFWADELSEAEWLAAPLLPARRSVALFAPGGQGKSLLALWLASCLATGSEIFGARRVSTHVLYLDYEMTRADLRERLEYMGYGPDTDLKYLHYALLPDLGPLDSRDGGDAVVALAHRVEAELVVIDTFGRAVAGKENDADTVRDWYRWTGQRLKNEGRAFIRIDHAGKNQEQGQRGTSAKNDDVDVVWKMARLDGERFRLTAAKRRLQWVEETVEVELVEEENVVGYRLLVGAATYPAGTQDLVDELDRLGIPVEWGRPTVARELRAKGLGRRNDVISAAIKTRRQRLENLSPIVPSGVFGESRPEKSGDNDETPAGSEMGQSRTGNHGERGCGWVSHLWDTHSPPPQKSDSPQPDRGVLG